MKKKQSRKPKIVTGSGAIPGPPVDTSGITSYTDDLGITYTGPTFNERLIKLQPFYDRMARTLPRTRFLNPPSDGKPPHS